MAYGFSESEASYSDDDFFDDECYYTEDDWYARVKFWLK
jgi:hypothetical protein